MSNNNSNDMGKEKITDFERKTIETKPEDGWVHEADVHEVNPNNYGKHHKGYSKTIVYTTSDSRITRPFVYGICTLFLIIGILSLLLGSWFFGIMFTASAVLVFCKVKKNIDKIEKELKANGHYDNSKEAQKKVQKELAESVSSGLEDAKKSTFTRNNFKDFKKVTLPIYCLITFIIPILLTFFVNLILGIVVLIVLILCGLIYYWLVSKIFKW